MVTKIKICKNTDFKKWNNFVENSPYGDVLQFWQWGELKKSEGFRPFRIAVITEENGQEKWLLAAQILLKKVSFLGNHAYIPSGPIFYEKNDLKIGLEKLKEFLTLNNKAYNFLCLEIEPKIGDLVDSGEQILQQNPNLKPFVDKEILEIIKKTGFTKTNRNIQPKFKLYYDLEHSEEELLNQCQKTTRYNIKLAAKKQVEVKEYLANDPQIPTKIQSFYDLFSKVQAKTKNTSIKPISSFQKMFDFFKFELKEFASEIDSQIDSQKKKNLQKPKEKIHQSIISEKNFEKPKLIFRDGVVVKTHPTKPAEIVQTFDELKKPFGHISLFEASYQDEIAAMNISFRTKFWASSFYASSNPKHLETKAAYLLRWDSIIQAKRFGSKVYDFWGIIPNKKDQKGYSDHKLGFGGVRIDNVGILSLPLNGFRYQIWRFGITLKTFLKKILKRN